MLNVLAIMGRLVADPELKHTPQGTSVVTFTVAVERSYCKQGEERQCDFIDCVAWRGTAEFVCKWFKKGNMIALDGSLQTRMYQDKNGNNRKAVEMQVGNVNFAGGKNDSQGTAQPQQAAPQSAPAPSYAQGGTDDFAVIDDNEDLPF